VPFDTPDGEGLTPVQIAGWEGLPDIMAYLLSLKPDLGHINGYGGTLLSTILHGSENNPNRSGRDYVTCLRLALEEGVACRAGPWRLPVTRSWPSSCGLGGGASGPGRGTRVSSEGLRHASLAAWGGGDVRKPNRDLDRAGSLALCDGVVRHLP
jgi:hypothetical protein